MSGIHPQGTPAAPPSAPQSAQEQKFDHITRVKHLMWSVKEAVAALMAISSQNLHRNVCIDLGMRVTDKVKRFDKQLEDFVSLCNQIELHLKTIHECSVQSRESQLYLNMQLNNSKPDTLDRSVLPPHPPGEPPHVSYNEYLSIIRNQANYSKDIQQIVINDLTGANQPQPTPHGDTHPPHH